jgi:hypothetical protein
LRTINAAQEGCVQIINIITPRYASDSTPVRLLLLTNSETDKQQQQNRAVDFYLAVIGTETALQEIGAPSAEPHNQYLGKNCSQSNH